MACTVILGTGIISVSTAYYLSDHQPPSSIHLVESASELFSSASGYAGGFLAKDWHVPAAQPLASLSFEEHRRLAESHGGKEKWGYTTSTSLGYAASTEKKSGKRGDNWLRDGTSRADTAPEVIINELDARAPPESAPSWLRRVAGDHIELITNDGTTAQLDPLLLCQFLLQECLKRGVKLHHPAAALSVSTDVRGELSSVRIGSTVSSTETDLPCTRIVIAAGAWSGRVFQSLFQHSKLQLPISSLAGHSIVLTSPRWQQQQQQGGGKCHAVYASHNTDEDEGGFAPEIFSRVNGHIYLAGLNSSAIPLPDAAGRERTPILPGAIAQLRETARELLGPSEDGADDDLEVVREGLCFRPVTPWGTPIVSRIPDHHLGVGMATRAGAEGGVFLAAGHGPWGISLSLGTGMVMAEMMQGRPLSADVGSLGLR
ncbi:FAD dependent oxidoreductase [Bombardia bombarda]|uniref:FAD dependent oxidoreductase n=1 Tax=Bombardia bombarda TaxID=252184 RepID=A0AA39T2K3_9PEZI|nr:FAD dependent oxidoreductase [Bombardia bombarda]